MTIFSKGGIIVLNKKGGFKIVRVKKEFCPNCGGTNPKCKYLEKGGRACRKGKAVGKNNEKQEERAANYDSLIGDYFTDYRIELDDQIIQWEKKILDPENIKVYSFYRYLRTKSEALASFYLRNDYDLRSEIYITLKAIKRKETRNKKEINKSIDKAKEV